MREPPFELLVFGIVGCPPSLLVTKAEDAIGHERDDREENRPGDPERQGDRVVDVAPVRGERRPPPRAEEVKQHRGDRDQKQYDCYSHPLCILAIKGCGYELKGGAHVCRDGGLHLRHHRASCLAHSTGRDVKADTNCTSRPLISQELGAFRILRWSPSSLSSIAHMEGYVTPWSGGVSNARNPTSIHRHRPFGDATQQTIVQMHNSPNRERYLASASR